MKNTSRSIPILSAISITRAIRSPGISPSTPDK